jgi:hypothetical protein
MGHSAKRMTVGCGDMSKKNSTNLDVCGVTSRLPIARLSILKSNHRKLQKIFSWPGATFLPDMYTGVTLTSFLSE